MKYKNLYNLEPGDKIVEPLFQTGFSMHHAVYLGDDGKGNEFIAENHKILGVRIVDANIFFSSVRKIERITKFVGDSKARALAIRRAISLRGKPYDLITYNCEHYANEVQLGSATSAQVRNAFLIFILAFLCLIYNEN